VPYRYLLAVKKSRRRFIEENLSDAIFHNVNLRNARIRGAFLANAEISGDIAGMKVNGVLVAPLVEAELDRLYPERAKLRPDSPEAMRETWSILEQMWKSTVERARRLPESKLHESVDEEWSFVETLRHLVMVTDSWIRRTVLNEKDHYYRAGLSHTDQPIWFQDACGLDPKADPSLDEVLEVRAERMAIVRTLVDGLTNEDIGRRCRGNRAPGYPTDPKRYDYRTCLWVLFNEEWEHHLFAGRDLELLEQDPSAGSSKKPRTTAPKKRAPKRKAGS
jgi:hypothetical protein